MANIETLEKVMVQQLKSEYNSLVKHDFMFGIFAISLGIAAVLATGWYLFFGPGLMESYASFSNSKHQLDTRTRNQR